MRNVIALLLAGVASASSAHDFWIDLRSYRVSGPTTVEARFLIGDERAPEPWETLWRRIVSLRDYAPSGVVDEQSGIRPDAAGVPGGAAIRLDEAGTHLIAFESYQAENDIAADEFNAYALHEGLTPALAKRRLDGTSGARGRELYSRRAKAIVQVGSLRTEQVTRPIGQTLEIVPERNPYGLRPGERLPVRILYRGRPLPGASVVIEQLDGAPMHGKPVLTDQHGRAALTFGPSGRWRVGVVWTQPIVHPRADFDTIFSSLTFGF